MDAKVFSFIQRPRWVVAVAIAIAVIVWSVSLYSIASQVGHPFPGFFYRADRIVSAYTPQDFTGWQAGLRPWDRIVEVNGQHWSEMRRLVQEAGLGNTLIYTVQRGDQRLHFLQLNEVQVDSLNKVRAPTRAVYSQHNRLDTII